MCCCCTLHVMTGHTLLVFRPHCIYIAYRCGLLLLTCGVVCVCLHVRNVFCSYSSWAEALKRTSDNYWSWIFYRLDAIPVVQPTMWKAFSNDIYVVNSRHWKCISRVPFSLKNEFPDLPGLQERISQRFGMQQTFLVKTETRSVGQQFLRSLGDSSLSNANTSIYRKIKFEFK